ncbi:uncharacterized protein LODBEIA_P39710 [Lodderomyces beijingensis]|uniref:Sister chromatid cohesion protein n=1 Tax=Lodderomyces beijingensis TaxID=1775926 RepID=A0ABP0ZNP8_9ASCO
MSTTKQHPESLREVLAAAPLLHLVPRQNVAPLIHLRSFVPSPDAAVFTEGVCKEIEAFDATDELRRFEKECQQELLAFSDGELDEVKFKTHAATDELPVELEYTAFEKQVLAKEILKDGTVEFAKEEVVKMDELSVETDLPVYDSEKLAQHNQKYFSKFQNEMTSIKSLDDVDAAGHKLCSVAKATPVHVAINIPKNSESLRNKQEGLFAPFVASNETPGMTLASMGSLCRLLQKPIQPNDNDLEILLVVQKKCEEQVQLSYDKLKSESESQVMNKDEKVQDEVQDEQFEISQALSMLSIVFASRSILSILKLIPVQNINTGCVILGLELVIDQLIVSNKEKANVPKEDPIDDAAAASVLVSTQRSVLTEVSNCFKDFASICHLRPFDDTHLTKLESVCIKLAPSPEFEDKAVFLPWDQLRLSCMTLLVSIFKKLQDQRLYLLMEVLHCFPGLSSKQKNIGKMFSTDRGFKCQFFSVTLVKFLHLSENPHVVADHIATECIKMIENDPTRVQQLLFNFAEDLLKLAMYPEWLGAKMILSSLLHQAVAILLPDPNDDAKPAEQQLWDFMLSISEKVISLNFKADTVIDERALCEIVSNCRSFDKDDAVEFLKANLRKLAGFVVIDNGETTKSESESETRKRKSSGNNDGVNKAYHYLIIRELRTFLLFGKYSKLVQDSLNCKRARVRSKAIKALSVLAIEEPDVISHLHVQKSLANAIQDQAATVRDAIIDFVGRYIKAHPVGGEILLSPLFSSLSDKSTLVRKKSIQLCMGVYHQLDDQHQLKVSLRIFEKLGDDEESVCNEATEALMQIYFPTDGKQLNFVKLSRWIKLALDLNGEKLMSFLRKALCNNDKLVAVTDSYSDMALSSALSEDNKTGGLRVLFLFTKVKPSLITQDRLEMLKPILVDPANGDTEEYWYALKILNCGTKVLRVFRSNFVEEIINLLLKRLPTATKREMTESIPVLATLTRYNHTEYRMVNATTAVMNRLKSVFTTPNNHVMVNKLLQLLAYFAKYCNLESLEQEFRNIGACTREEDRIMKLIGMYIMIFTAHEKMPIEITRVAYPCIIVCMTNDPKHLLTDQIMERFDAMFYYETDFELKKRVIQEFIIFLQENGAGLDQRAVSDGSNSDYTQLNGLKSQQQQQQQQQQRQQACTVLVQKSLQHILALCLIDDGQMAFMPFGFVALALDLGYANPILCVSTLIALQGSPQAVARRAAHEVYVKLFDKHRSLVDTHYQHGIKLAFESELTAIDMFRLLYAPGQDSKLSRNKFVKALTKSLTPKPRNNYQSELKMLIFVVERMTRIPFKTVEEIYIIMDHLQSSVQESASDFILDWQSQALAIKKELAYYWALSIFLLNDFCKYLAETYHIKMEDVENFGNRCLEYNPNQAPKKFKNAPLNLKWVFENANEANAENVFETCMKELEKICLIYKSHDESTD